MLRCGLFAIAQHSGMSSSRQTCSVLERRLILYVGGVGRGDYGCMLALILALRQGMLTSLRVRCLRLRKKPHVHAPHPLICAITTRLAASSLESW